MTRLRSHPAVAAAFVVLLLVGAVAPFMAAPAYAQDSTSDDEDEDSGFFDRLVGADNDGDGGILAGVLRTIGIPNPTASARNWMYRNVQNPFSEPKRTADECATDIAAEVNNHSEAYTKYANERATAYASRDVVAVRCELTRDGETNEQTVYVTADVNGSDYENLSASTTAPENRSVDHTLVLTGMATEEMPDDFVTFREEYVEQDKTPTRGFVISKGAKYKGYVFGSPSFLPAYDKETATGEK